MDDASRAQLRRIEAQANRAANLAMWSLLVSVGVLGKVWGFPEMLLRLF